MIKEKYFKDKKITLMGLGILGRGVNVARFLAESGAKLVITDLKTKKELSPSLRKLAKFKNIKYVLDKHCLADFRNCDMIIRAANAPLDSIYLKEAKKNKIPIEMDASLFAKLSEAFIIGITGTRGKSTTTYFIYQTLKDFLSKKAGSSQAFLGGNIKGLATLPLLKKAKKNDFVVLELDSWQLQGFGQSKISPDISIFTSFIQDHLNYYTNLQEYFNDKANIFKYQIKDNYLITNQETYQKIKKRFKQKIKSQIIIAKPIPKNWSLKIIGQHNRENIALGSKTLEILGVNKSFIKKSVQNFSSPQGRLELIKKHKGISYYNDTNATTPEAVIAALESLNQNKNIILIAGGSDKNLEYSQMAKVIQKTTKALILFKGLATDKIIKQLPKNYQFDLVDNMKEAMIKAQIYSQKGDLVLLSPGAASFGIFKNEYDRGEQFNKLIKRIK